VAAATEPVDGGQVAGREQIQPVQNDDQVDIDGPVADAIQPNQTLPVLVNDASEIRVQ
jgi:hypothetical protein